MTEKGFLGRDGGGSRAGVQQGHLTEGEARPTLEDLQSERDVYMCVLFMCVCIYIYTHTHIHMCVSCNVHVYI